MKVKITHKEFCQADCQSVQGSRKTDRKTWSQRICSFCWVEGGRYRTSWLVACCMLGSAERFQSRGTLRKEVSNVFLRSFHHPLSSVSNGFLRSFHHPCSSVMDFYDLSTTLGHQLIMDFTIFPLPRVIS